MKPKNILFICTGNTCRSPMAMAILKQWLTQNSISDISVESAGLAAFGDEISENALQALNEIGIDLAGHVSKPVTAELLDEADLIAVMSDSHKTALLRFGVESDKIVVLGGGISDPYGGNLEVYRHTRDQIKSAVIALAKERGLTCG